MAYVPTRISDPSVTYTKAISWLVVMFMSMGLLMFILERLSIEGLCALLVIMFAVGLAVPQNKGSRTVTLPQEYYFKSQDDCAMDDDKSG